MSLTGRLLVASPRMSDPNFRRTVILVCAHDDDGTLGLILNRPTDMRVDDHLDGWDAIVGEPDVVFFGGPVQNEVAVGLAAGPGIPPPHVVGGAAIVDVAAGVPGEAVARIFSGYSGWGPGQLETELTAKDWFVVEADPADPFTDDPSRLWSAVLGRQDGRYALYTNYPEDPRLN